MMANSVKTTICKLKHGVKTNKQYNDQWKKQTIVIANNNSGYYQLKKMKNEKLLQN